MKSTFHYKENPKHSDDHETAIEADHVQFVPGYVIFYEFVPINKWPVAYSRIIRAVSANACHDLREVVNDPEDS